MVLHPAHQLVGPAARQLPGPIGQVEGQVPTGDGLQHRIGWCRRRELLELRQRIAAQPVVGVENGFGQHEKIAGGY